MERINAILRDLTVDDLDRWAGAKVRTRGKSSVKRVDGLHRTPDDELVAWVSGTEEYATLVRIEQAGRYDSFCTCPQEGGPCTHAVAVILAAAERVKRQEEIPLLSEDDDLYLILIGDQGGEAGWEEVEEVDAEVEEEIEEAAVKPAQPEVVVRAAPDKGKKAGKTSVRKLLVEKSREELLELMLELAGDYPEVERRILEAEQLESGRIDPLVRSLRKEINSLTTEPAWYNHWKHEGNVPDFTHVREQFRALLNKGYADVLLQLGDELWQQGSEQVEQSDDEGATGRALGECLEIVLQAVPRSTLTPPRQLLWVIDRLLEDEFSLLESGEEVLQNSGYSQADWCEVAAALEIRLEAKTDRCSLDFSGTYQRKGVMNWLIRAYQQSGGQEKILPLLEKEADICQNYEQLVDALLATGDRELARQWCIRGFAKTSEKVRGIAANLQKRLREMALMEKRYDLVAAYRAQDFFDRATLETYKELRKAGEKAGAWPIIRTAVLGFLESGHRPDLPAKGGKPLEWPLPEPEVRWSTEKKRGSAQRFPQREILIDIAILEKRFDDAVALYRALQEAGRVGWHTDQTVAKAVSATHPDVALGIWRGIVDSLIAQVKPDAYAEAGGYLRLMHKVFEANQRLGDWQALLAELRRTHKAKKRLLEVLDSLSPARKKSIE